MICSELVVGGGSIFELSRVYSINWRWDDDDDKNDDDDDDDDGLLDQVPEYQVTPRPDGNDLISALSADLITIITKLHVVIIPHNPRPPSGKRNDKIIFKHPRQPTPISPSKFTADKAENS